MPPKPPATDDQFETDFWFAHARQTLSVQEVATAFGMTARQVREFVEAGLFVAATKSDQPNERNHITLERWSVVAWRLNEIEKSAGSLPPIKETKWVSWWRGELTKREQQLNLSTRPGRDTVPNSNTYHE